MGKLKIKLENYHQAVHRLLEAVTEYSKMKANDIIRDGVIQRFEFTYELAWKTTKAYLENIGIVDKNSPKAVMKEAFAQKLIENEENWILILNDRNLTSHVYNKEMAEEIVERIINIYLKEFQSLLSELEKYQDS